MSTADEIVGPVNRLVGIFVYLQLMIEEGLFNHEELDELRLVSLDLAEILPGLIEHVQARREIPESWLKTPYGPWRGERFEDEPE